MLDKLLASVRIGGATVDTRLATTRLQPGEKFEAEIVVEGGEAEQEIDEFELQLMAELREEVNEPGRNKMIDSWEIDKEFTIHEGEQKVIPMEGRIHPETPVTEINVDPVLTKVWIATGMDIEKGIDAKDKDYLQIEPTPAMKAMLKAVEQSGFRLHKVTTDPDRIRTDEITSDLAFDQEFEFKPTSGDVYIEEVEIHFVPRDDKTHVLLEFDKHSGSENFHSMSIDNDDFDVDDLAERFQHYLDRA